MVSLTVKSVVSVAPSTVCVKVPAPSLPVLTTVTWYVVSGCNGPTSPVAADPVTLVVSTDAAELTGVAVSAEETNASGLAPFGVQETWN